MNVTGAAESLLRRPNNMAATAEALKAVKDVVDTQAFDINKSLGLTREKQQYDSRLEALTAPGEYARKCEAEWNKMVDEVKGYFEKTVAYLGNAGFDWEESKEKAKVLTKEFAAIERQKLELRFPTAANVIGAQRQVDLSFSAGAGQFNPAELAAAAQPGPIQPARKKSSKKK